jgi:hypothetical protein
VNIFDQPRRSGPSVYFSLGLRPRPARPTRPENFAHFAFQPRGLLLSLPEIGKPRDQAGCYQGSRGKRAWPRLANLQTQESLPQTSTHCLTTCKVTKIRGWLAQWSSGWSPPSRSGGRNLTAYVSVSDCLCLIPVSVNILLANTPIRCQSRSPGGGLIDFNPNQL